MAKGDGVSFVGNDLNLGGETASGTRILLVTGPNMAGKSTYLRQNALIVVLAQAGSFVPARSAHIGIVDRLFSRVGAADDLARGRSTFMVEMVETAAILNQATERSSSCSTRSAAAPPPSTGSPSPGRRSNICTTSTSCRALFATHYHELTALADRLPRAANATVEVKEWKDDIVFLHRVVPGAADRSYGIHVAKLAGLPRRVLARAGEVLRELERADNRRKPADLVGDLPLFSAARAARRSRPQMLAARGRDRGAPARCHDPA